MNTTDSSRHTTVRQRVASHLRLTLAWRCLLLLFLSGSVQSALAITGTVTGTFDERLLLSACADGYKYPSFTLYLKTGGYFSLRTVGRTYTGTFTRNSSQTSLVFTLDAASRTRLKNAVALYASSLCGTTVTVSSYTPPVFKVALAYGASRSSTCNITGAMSVSATGRTAYGSGTAKYQVYVAQACFTGKP